MTGEIDNSAIIEKFLKHMRRLVRESADKLELSEEERFACCIVAGLPLKTSVSPDGNTMKFETTERAAVIRVDGKWCVVRSQ